MENDMVLFELNCKMINENMMVSNMDVLTAKKSLVVDRRENIVLLLSY